MCAQRVQHAARPYRKQKRAENEQETRRRITEAAVALHQRLGPARTTILAIAELAGVQRGTVYRHFPDEEALFHACTAHYYAQHPMPDPQRWAAIATPDERLGVALGDLYAWYAETEEMLRPGIRDLDQVPASARDGFVGHFAHVHQVLMTGRRERGRARARVSAAIGHAIAFSTWQSLVREHGLRDAEATDLMTALVDAARRPR